MSLQVNFTTHGKDLRVTYEDILNSTSGNDWALFGYDKGSNDLKVLGTGSGGLEELQDEFVDGKIQYAFARVVDPNSNLSKFVLIGWCGDGVPESKKGLFNTHLADVSRFLKGYHLQINARSEDDVTPQQIMKRVDEASASKYSFHKEVAKGRDLITPLQSAYKKTEIPDIAAMQRTPAKPESAPKVTGAYSSTPPVSSSSSSSIASRWNPTGASTSSSTPPTSTTTTGATTKPLSTSSWRSGASASVTPSSGTTFNKVAPPASLANYTVERNEPTMNRAAQLRMEREQREREERARVEQEIKAREAREQEAAQASSANKVAEERRLQEEREKKQQQEEAQQRQARQAQEDEARQQRERDERERLEQERQAAAEAEKSARAAREAAKAREQGEIEAARARARQLEEEQAREAEEAEERLRAERQRKEEEEEDRRRHRQLQQEAEEAEEARRRAEEEEEKKKKREEEERARRQQQEEEEAAAEQERRLQQEVQAATAQSVNLGADALIASSEHPERAAGQSKTAVVLYAYEAAEANEMSLVEGEIIYNVTELDVGWWTGESEDGVRSGLFPANYVELIEHQHAEPNGGLPGGVGGGGGGARGHEEEQEAANEYQHQQQQHHHHQAPAGAAGGGASDKPTAVALYDYAAGEPNEISFTEGETIVDIEQVTDDWWQGMNQKGDVGLFPANYVELHQ